MSKQYIQRFGRNEKGRDFVVGDIHGEFDLLFTELANVDFDKTVDRLFSVGDLIDRGPSSLEVLSLIRETWFWPVVGNHEDMMFQYVLGKSYCGINMFIPNGGDWWFRYQDNDNAIALVREAWQTLPLAIEIDHQIGRVGIAHAAPVEWSDEALARREAQSRITWDRDTLYDAMRRPTLAARPLELDRLYMGHTPLKEPFEANGLVWLDTGAVYTGKLTIMEIK